MVMGFDSRQDLRFFSLSHARDILNITYFLFTKIFHLLDHVASSIQDACHKDEPSKYDRAHNKAPSNSGFILEIGQWGCGSPCEILGGHCSSEGAQGR